MEKERGGVCHSKFYKNVTSKLVWECEKNHLWETSAEVIRKGSWCPVCSRERRSKYSIDDMIKLASKYNGLCLSEKYINNKTKLKWQCSKGHTFERSPKSVIKGVWCTICPRKEKPNYHNRYSIKDMKDIALLKGGKCLSTHYKNINTKLKLMKTN